MMPQSSYARTLGIVSGIGIQFVVAVGVGIGVGAWADRRFGTKIVWTMVGMVLGLLASAVVVVRLLRLLGTGQEGQDK